MAQSDGDSIPHRPPVGGLLTDRLCSLSVVFPPSRLGGELFLWHNQMAIPLPTDPRSAAGWLPPHIIIKKMWVSPF
jgi:hypothetical protein